MNEFESYIHYYEEKRKKHKDYFFALLILIAILVFVFNYIIPMFFYSKVEVVGGSMLSTIVGKEQKDSPNKDLVGIRHTKKIQRGDIVVFYPYGKEGDLFIKRVIALEGDTVTIGAYILDKTTYYKLVVTDSKGNVLIDGNESYIKEPMKKGTIGSTTIKKGEFYALGDNRNNSDDSRSIGAFQISSIYGVGRRIYREEWSIKIGSFVFYTSYSSKKIINPLLN